jgi:hypothetical protein
MNLCVGNSLHFNVETITCTTRSNADLFICSFFFVSIVFLHVRDNLLYLDFIIVTREKKLWRER